MNTGTDKQRKALGKGLSALLPGRAPERPTETVSTSPAVISAQARVPIDRIKPNPMQPRTIFQPDRLEELAASIRANGIIQPIIVRRDGTDYQIVAGERRWRAARLAGIVEMPVVVQEISDNQLLQVALIENLQREDLNPMETAHAYDRLHRELGLSHEEIGRRTGKDRTSIVNMMRLLRLPKEVQALLAGHRISMGHARAVLALPSAEQQIEVAEKAAAQGLNVRQVEALVQRHKTRNQDRSEHESRSRRT
jgi:ParB family transcriptional regulator, chromosome partitioning protein